MNSTGRKLKLIKMKANELTKGQRVTLKNGFQAEIQNNKKGNIREAIVYGYAVDHGRIYIWDIVGIELTPKQEKDRKTVQSFGF